MIRLFFEPEDIDVDTIEDALKIYKFRRQLPTVMKHLPVDKDGFIIEQPKLVE